MNRSHAHKGQNGDASQGQQDGLQPLLPFALLPLVVVEFQGFVEFLQKGSGLIAFVILDFEFDFSGVIGGDLLIDAADFL